MTEGNSLQAKIFKKVTGAKPDIVGSSEENFEKFGRWSYSGNVLK